MFTVVVTTYQGGRLVREPGTVWHPDFETAQRWWQSTIAMGYPEKCVRIQKMQQNASNWKASWIDPHTGDPLDEDGKKKGQPDAALLAALSSMA